MPRNAAARARILGERASASVAKGDMVFVFGSNLAGRHGMGAALWARRYRGAIPKQGEGRQGNAYAIPTKGRDRDLTRLPLPKIKEGVDRFLEYARSNPELQFEVTAIGTGLAGYKPEEIAPFFADEPLNVFLPTSFKRVLGRKI